MRAIRLVVSIAISSLIFSSSALASSSVVEDPVGDIASGLPAHLDIVQAKVTYQHGVDTLVFSIELAAPLTAAPSDDFIAYNWFTGSTDGSLSGFLDVTSEFVVVVRWCTERTTVLCFGDPTRRWEAFVNHFGVGIDRSPVFKIDGASVKVFVNPRMLGDPSFFYWASLTRHVPAGTGPAIDFAPQTSPMLFSR